MIIKFYDRNNGIIPPQKCASFNRIIGVIKERTDPYAVKHAPDDLSISALL